MSAFIETSVSLLSIFGSPLPAPSSDAQLSFNGTLLAAIIGATATVTVGLIALFQFYKARQSEREKERTQQQNEDLQRRLDRAAQEKQFEREIEKLEYETVLAARQETLERERQRKERTRTAARDIMREAQTPHERARAYRSALHADPNISHLQILDMAYPMEVTKVYVRLRLHQETRLRYDVDAALLAAEERGDPNALIKARYALLETRSQAAMTPEEAFKKYPRAVVLGDPGAGKSTLLKYLALQSVDGQLQDLPDLPVHIALGDFASSTQQDLLRFAAQRWDEWYGFAEDEAYQYIESRLNDGNAILLLDALDETVIGGSDERARDSYTRVLAAVHQVAVRYSKAPIVVTARKAGYHQRTHLGGFTELEVLDFRPQEIEAFVNNWFKHHPLPPRHATAGELNAQLTRNPRIQSLASNPLLLSLIVMVYELHLELPERRADIYKQCIDLLLSRWDTSRDIRRRRKFKAEHKQDLLAEIAWHFHTHGRRYFPEDELLEVIARFLPTIDCFPQESKDILYEIEEENGLLKEQAHGWHGFLHLTLQEYFVAEYLCNEEQGFTELLSHCGDPWWEEVMLLYIGSVRDASPLLRELLRMERRQWLWQDVFHTPLLWAGQCLAAKPRRVQKELRTQILDRLFHVLRKTSYQLTREEIAKTLLSIDSSDARGKLITSLKDKQENRSVYRSIAGALKTLGDQGVVPELLALLKDKQEYGYVRKRIAEALGTLGDQRVIPELLALLKDKQEYGYVRWCIAEALGTLGEKGVIPDLLVLLKDKQEDANVRGGIAGALGTLGEKGVIPDLLVLLKDKQEHEDVRGGIAGALGTLGEKGVISDLLGLLKDKQEHEDVRRSIPEALGTLGDQGVIPELLSLLKDKQEDEYVRRSIPEALGTLGEKGVIPDLLSLLKDKQEHEYVRWDIVRVLGTLGDQGVIPDLLALLKDKQEHKDVRRSIVRALGRLGDRGVVSKLLNLLKDKQEDKSVRRSIVESLIKLGQQEAVFPYLTLVKKEAKKHPPIPSDFMWNYASLRVFAPLLHPDNAYFQRTLWEAAQREKVHILTFGFWRIRFVRVVRHKQYRG